MFALLITESNLSKIEERVQAITETDRFEITHHLAPKGNWYLITGYVPERGGPLMDYTLLPTFIVHKNYEIDVEHAKTDWDQIVRK